MATVFACGFTILFKYMIRSTSTQIHMLEYLHIADMNLHTNAYMSRMRIDEEFDIYIYIISKYVYMHQGTHTHTCACKGSYRAYIDLFVRDRGSSPFLSQWLGTILQAPCKRLWMAMVRHWFEFASTWAACQWPCSDPLHAGVRHTYWYHRMFLVTRECNPSNSWT